MSATNDPRASKDDPQAAEAGWRLDGLGLEARDNRVVVEGLRVPQPEPYHKQPVGDLDVEFTSGTFRIWRKSWRDLHFVGCDLSETSLSSSKVINCVFEKCKLQHASLWTCQITDCRFIRCDLKDMVPGGVDFFCNTPNKFTRAVFERCDLRHSHHGHESYSHCQFLGCRLDLVDFMGAVFEDCLFEGVLKETIFRRTDPFQRGGRSCENRFLRCDLRRAKLIDCQFFHIEFDPAILPEDEDLIVLPGGPDDLEKWQACFREEEGFIRRRRGWSGKPTVLNRRGLEETFTEDQIGWLLDIAAGGEGEPYTDPNAAPAKVYASGEDADAIVEALPRGRSLTGFGLEEQDGRLVVSGIQFPQPTRKGRSYATEQAPSADEHRFTVSLAKWIDVHFVECDFSEALFSHCQLRNCIFECSKFGNAAFGTCAIVDCRFLASDLRHLVMEGLGPKLVFDEPNSFSRVEFHDCDFRSSSHSDEEYLFCRFLDCRLDAVEFEEAVFEDSAFEGMLKDTSFGVYMAFHFPKQGRRNRFLRCDFTKAKIDGVDFIQMEFDPSILPRGDEDLIILPDGPLDLDKWQECFRRKQELITLLRRVAGCPTVVNKSFLLGYAKYSEEEVGWLVDIAMGGEGKLRQSKP